jgi:5-methylcytosine-specific restriction protein A
MSTKRYAKEHPVCEICGSSNGLGRVRGGVHHIVYRSHGGDDRDSNLITLCGQHHTEVHDGEIDSEYLMQIKEMSRMV